MHAAVTTDGMSWRRIPDGVRVRHLAHGEEGLIDGLTEIVEGRRRNPDGATQYRIDTGTDMRSLAAEEELLILVDEEGLVIMRKEPVEYRKFVTDRLHGTFPHDRFVPRKKKNAPETNSRAQSSPHAEGGPPPDTKS